MRENDIDSLENSTENTKKRILPNRPGRGKLMKLLQEKEPDEEDELYNMIFAEKSSDEEFNPSQTELSEDSQISLEKVPDLDQNSQADAKEHDSSFASEISIEEELPKHTRTRTKIKMVKKENRARESKVNRNKKEIDEILDIDLLDIDKIDEMEEMKDKGILPLEISSEEISDDEEDEESFNKRKNWKGKSKKKAMNKQNNLNLYRTNLKADEYTTLTKKSYRKTFIDDEEPDTFMKKRRRPFTHKIKKKEKTLKKFFSINENVIYNRDDPDTIIISKAVFDDENSNEFGQKKEDDDIMEYNDEFFRDQQKHKIQYEEDNKKIIKKFNKIPEKTEGAVVKYNFMQEKLSQKDLLIEAIFTEYYNIQSLQEMQRLDDLKKKEMPTQGRREFTEYVRVVKRLPNVNLKESYKQPVEEVEGGVLRTTGEIEKVNEEGVGHSVEKDESKHEEIKASEILQKVQEKLSQDKSNGKI